MNALNSDPRVHRLLTNQPRKFLRGGYDGSVICILHTGAVWTGKNGEVIKDDHLSDEEVKVLGAIAVDVARKLNFRKPILITDSDTCFHGHTKRFFP
jgi:hypothetical protein